MRRGCRPPSRRGRRRCRLPSCGHRSQGCVPSSPWRSGGPLRNSGSDRPRLRFSTRKLRRRHQVCSPSSVGFPEHPSNRLPASISVLQWLLNAETSHPTSSPPHRLTRFFTTLHAALKNPSRAVFQFYPTSDDQIQLITSIAQKAGFGGGVVVDYPNSKKARKVFLCLFVGGGGNAQQVPKGLEGGEVEGEGKALFEKRRERLRSRGKDGKRKGIKNKEWILKKKEVGFSYQCFEILFTRSLALPSTGKRGRAERLKIHWTQAEGCLLRHSFRRTSFPV